MDKIPAQYSLCKFMAPEGYQYPIANEEHVVFFGEIPNMPGHCIVLQFKGNKNCLLVGYHTENFIELSDGEV